LRETREREKLKHCTLYFKSTSHWIYIANSPSRTLPHSRPPQRKSSAPGDVHPNPTPHPSLPTAWSSSPSHWPLSSAPFNPSTSTQRAHANYVENLFPATGSRLVAGLSDPRPRRGPRTMLALLAFRPLLQLYAAEPHGRARQAVDGTCSCVLA